MIERSKVGITSPGQFVYAVKDAEGNVVYVRRDQKYINQSEVRALHLLKYHLRKRYHPRRNNPNSTMHCNCCTHTQVCSVVGCVSEKHWTRFSLLRVCCEGNFELQHSSFVGVEGRLSQMPDHISLCELCHIFL